ncbi:protein translocase SEC61 complex subunit gamma [Hyperthermus butylicus]|uniref:Protein translocase subunit SecE n=1 Tax=Hyperthermus butylicus (strain DSM 5456 / JCM 9403 / PLM1-5) TaxID=415426 RepID=A2BN61_HYPBU|nr:protein translocase SEC61 complex subunit gamma [Hyperthermus butylicus]ABM81422.1 hypothetical protein Hbut_1603 [Hyperthermus butylicus DSM 5456]
MASKERESSGPLGYIRMALHEWRLILQRVRKPDREEYIHTAKIIWLAILLVGSVAYVIHLVATQVVMGG